MNSHGRGKFRLAITAFATTVALSVAPITATATPDSGEHVARGESAIRADLPADLGSPEATDLQREIAAIYTYTNDELVLDYNSAAQDPEIRVETLDDFAAGLVAGGGSVAGTPAQVSDAQASADRLKSQMSAQGFSKASCSGKNGWRTFYPTIFLNSCGSNALAASLAAGAGVAGLAALITSWTGAGPAVAGAIAAALAVSGSLTALCNSWGRGIQLFITPFGTVCWSQ